MQGIYIQGDLHWEICIHGGSASMGASATWGLHPGVCIWVGQNHHPPFGYYGIRSTSGRYVVVSYFDYLYGLSLLLSIVKSHWCSCLSSTIWTNSSSVQNRKKIDCAVNIVLWSEFACNTPATRLTTRVFVDVFHRTLTMHGIFIM